MNKILVTGTLGFIGFHLTNKLVSEGFDVVGIDNINDYYDVKLKYAKLPKLGIDEKIVEINKIYRSKKNSNFRFAKIDLKDREEVKRLLENEKFDIVCHMAAQAGIQYSIKNPYTYIENNINGFINLLENAKQINVKHFLYASSSSVYGERTEVPFKESDAVEKPISLYAATKKSNELIAHSYNHLFNIKMTGLRFFTVYGPWGRPDMAPFIFVSKIINDDTIRVFNNGDLERDFTYIDDIVDGLYKVIVKSKPDGKYNIYNIGNSKPVNLMDFINSIEKALNKKAKIEYLPMRQGDVLKTFSDTEKLRKDFGYQSKTNVQEGIDKFIRWYENFYSE